MDTLLKNRKIRLFMAFFSLLILFNMIQESYAKYVSSAEASSDLTIAKWSFLVNDQDVLANSDFSNTITPVFPGNNYVASGYIAPNTEGYFDIEIDSSNVDVTFQETITLALADDNTITDLAITGYKINNGQLITYNGSPIVTQHALNEQNTVNTYRIYVKWLEGLNETMDNEDDTSASVDGVASIDVTIDFLQTTNSN